MGKVYIFEHNATTFNNRGLGVLKNTITCNVYEYKNGMYEVCLQYPLMDFKTDLLKEERIIYCSTPSGYQPFRIYSIKDNDEDMIKEVYAYHIFYDLQDNFLKDCNIVGATATTAITHILESTLNTHNFTGGGTLTTTANSRLVRKNVVEAILGSDENSIINRFGGELERNGFNVNIHEKYGRDRGVCVKYAKDITGLNVQTNMTTIATRIVPQGFNGLLLPEYYVDSPLINNYNHVKTRHEEFPNIKAITEEYTDEEAVPLSEAYELLREAANKMFSEHKVDIPETTVKVNIVDLKKTLEYKNYSNLVSIYPFDTITIKHKILGLDIKVTMNYYQWDSLRDEYVKMEFGNAIGNFANTLNKSYNTGIKLTKEQTNLLLEAKEAATELINSGLGGYVMKTRDELLIMDTDDVSTATKVWRWNLNGLGFSNTGYNGTYGTAITMDGNIVADYITTGILTAITIQSVNKNFVIDLSSNGGASFYNNNKLAMKMQGNAMAFYNWGKDGDYIGSIGSVNTFDDNYPDGNPNKPNISIWNDLDSSLSLGYATSQEGRNGIYIRFDKYNIIGSGQPIRMYEGVDFHGGVRHYANLHMQGYEIFMDSDGGAYITNTIVNSTHKAVRVSNMWVNGMLWVDSVQVTGADYAECFEWKDGNIDNEDRIGYLVSLEGNKIIKANGDDIIGVISGTASVIGDNANEWTNKYITDKFGRCILDNEGNKIINPDFDESKEYITRSERKEWGVVGLVGKIFTRQDGSLSVGDYVTAKNGIATKSGIKTNIRVLEIIDEEVVRVLIR